MIKPPTDHWNRDNGQYYDQALLAYVALLHDPLRVSVDVGANVGHITRFLALRSRAAVIAIEPGRANLECLHANVADLGNVYVVERAASDECGLTVNFVNGGTVTDRVAPTTRSKKLDPVITTTVDDLQLASPVGLVKIDVEGYELRVLRGARTTIERDRPVIVVEVIDKWLGRYGATRADILHFFADLDYQSPVDRLGRRTTEATDLIFAPRGTYLPRLYLAHRPRGDEAPESEPSAWRRISAWWAS